MIAIIISSVLAVLWYLAIDDIVAAHKYRKRKERKENEE